MPTFEFAISGARPFRDEVQLPSFEAAWQQALSLARDIEDSLELGGTWKLEVSEAGTCLFRLEIGAVDLRLRVP